MTESEFLRCANPAGLLTWMENRRRITDRQLRLWACGCVRLVWPLLSDDRSRRAVEVSEQLADGQAREA